MKLICRPAAVLIALLWVSGCLHDSDEDHAPLRRSVSYQSVRALSVVQAWTANSLEVGLFVGPDGCWSLEFLEVEVEDQILRVHGGAINSNDPDAGCTDALVRATVSVQVPPLPPGEYEIEAGRVHLGIISAESAGGAEQRMAFVGEVRARGDCARVLTGDSSVTLTGLPAELPIQDYSVEGVVVSSASCSEPSAPSDIVIEVQTILGLDPGPAN